MLRKFSLSGKRNPVWIPEKGSLPASFMTMSNLNLLSTPDKEKKKDKATDAYLMIRSHQWNIPI